MLDYSREAVALIAGKNRAHLDTNRMLALAVTHLVEIVGEAASRIPKEDREPYPDIPWAAVVGVRNRLVHGYDTVDFDILWEILTKDLPPIIAALEKIPALHS